MRNEEVDIVVIGGGPAGAAYATITARAGLRVRVLEGSRFPRHHIGESLLAMSMPLLRSLGVVDDLDAAGFLPKTGAVFVWGAQHRRLDLGFPAPYRAYQVTRGEFDRLLLGHAKQSGANVWQDQWVKSVLRSGAGRVHGVVSDGDHGPTTHHAALVVDASGLFQFLHRRLGLCLQLNGPQRVAISGYYQGAGRLVGDQATNIISEACRDGWLWFIPLSPSLTSVGFVGDGLDLCDPPRQVLAEQIATTQLIASLLTDARATTRPRLLHYTNHIAAGPLWQDGYLLVGDCALFVDPLFSTGVHGALYGGTLAAAATVSVLQDQAPEAELAEWYDQRMRAHYARVQSMVQLLYGINGGQSRFWRSRDLQDMTDAEAEQVAQALGPISIPFFRTAHEHRTLDIPPALAPLLGEFWTNPVTNDAVTADRVALCDSVLARHTWTRRGDRLVRAVALTDPGNRRSTVEIPAASAEGRFIERLALGPVTCGEWRHDRRLTALMSVLNSSGLVQENMETAREMSAF
jgi:halogenation protein CepH